MSPMPQENLEPFFRYYAGEPHQMEAVQLLQQSMPASLLKSDSAWIEHYRNKPEGEALLANPLNVSFDSQLDNPSGEGFRECFSSSCAMAAKFWLPELQLDEYHRRRPKYGDSTDPSAQIRCLESFGLSARFTQVGSVEKLKAQIDRGRPSPVGYLQNGPVSQPYGGGHYCICIGYDDTGFWMHDPYGSCDLVNGGFTAVGGTSGKMVHYSYKNWVPRWSVANDSDGWGVDIWLPGK